MKIGALPLIALALAFVACENPNLGPDEDSRPGIAGRSGTEDRVPGTTGTTGDTKDRDRTLAGTNENAARGGGRTGMTGPVVDPTQASPRPAENFVAMVHGAEGYANLRGKIELRKSGNNVDVAADLKGIPAGTYDYSVHTYGDCSAPDRGSIGPMLDFAAIGGGARPVGGEPRGGMGGTPPMGGPGTTFGPGATPPPGETPGTAPGATPGGTTGGGTPATTAYTGNLGPLEVKNGTATAKGTVTGLTTDDLGLLAGRSIVVHAREDAAKAKAGGMGKVVACGVLGVAGDTGRITPTSTAPID